MRINRRLAVFLLRRIGHLALVLLGLSIFIFVVARVLPGDPVRMALGANAPDYAVERYRKELHLDEPIYIQYYYWLAALFRGSLGSSIVTRRDVFTDIIQFLPATLELVILAAAIEIVVSTVLGVLAARRARTWVDTVIRVTAYLGIAIPSFVWAILFILIFGNFLRVFPVIGRLTPGVPAPPTITGMYTIDALITGNFATFIDAIKHILLPSLCLALPTLATMSRITRASVMENSQKDYILSATSHGISEKSILFKYLLKPSLIPTVTMSGLNFANYLAQAFLIELIFNWPGFSRYGMTALFNKDLNAIVGVVLTTGFIFAVAVIIADLLVISLDPRIRLAEKAE